MKFAIIRTGGKQYPVSEGQTITVEKLPGKDGGSVTFKDVLLYADGKTVQIGTPKVSGVTVSGSIVSQQKSKKVRVVKYKNKIRYKRTHGHRQQQTKVKIEKVTAAK